MRPLSRRSFLSTGGSAALSLIALRFPLAQPAAKAAGSNTAIGAAAAILTGWSTDPFVESTFTPLVNSSFQAQVGARVVDMQLVKVTGLSQRTIKGNVLPGQQFSLDFEAAGPAFAQETYALAHSTLGHFALFLVPVGQPQGSVQTYQAIVNNARA